MILHLSVPVSEKDHIQGSESASITLLQYGDYECPYTRRSNLVVQALQRQFKDRLRFVYRNFPLTQIHPHAQHAAEAAEAAAAQNTFWEMHNYLFQHQNALADKDLVTYARTFGLDIARFEQELTEHTYAKHIQDDLASGRHSGVHGTPTFFINGVIHQDTWDLDTILASLPKL
jgi:protein-disulfide isomerase